MYVHIGYMYEGTHFIGGMCTWYIQTCIGHMYMMCLCFIGSMYMIYTGIHSVYIHDVSMFDEGYVYMVHMCLGGLEVVEME